MEVSFWRHKSKSAGYATLYCRISIKGERVDIGSTGIKVRFDDWDSVGEKVLDRDPESHFKNDKLLSIRLHLSAIFNDLFRAQETITAGKILRLYRQKGQQSISLLSAFDLYLKDSKKDKERDLSKASLVVYDNCRKKVVDFLLAHKAADLPVDEFDLTWLKNYRKWMKSVSVTGDKTGHADSYIAKHSQIIKNVLTWAKLNKHTDQNPLDGYRIKGAEFDDPVYLSKEEFAGLRAHKFRNPHLQEVADVFVVLCRTGFHYGDLKDLVKQHRTALQRGIDGETWLIKKRIKTKVAARVPVFKEVSEIVQKYGGWENLPMRPLSKFNDRLKLVAAELNLHPDLSSKAGRKTFTDWCFNELNLTTDAVMVLLGRKSSKGLEVYGRPDERRVIHELKGLQTKRRKEKSA
ncbi:phage integrase SAM-like domain-containing protein [Larkinella arboricola]